MSLNAYCNEILAKMWSRSLPPIESLLDRAQGDTFSVPSLEKVGKSMASIGSLTVPVDFEITETSKQVLRPLVAQLMSEALEGSQTIIKSEEDLRAFVRQEVRKALKDVLPEHEAEITQKGATNMGKPSKGTPADRRLKQNNPNAGKPAQPKPASAPKKASK